MSVDVSPCLLECVHGVCQTESVVAGSSISDEGIHVCICDHNWGGKLCNMYYTVCNDGHKCYNGSECVQKTDTQYGCDCATAYDHSAFSGHMCENPATSYCEFGTSLSYRSFCSNNGVCKDYVVAGEDGKLEHPGCYCSAGFEGDHCQYLLGEGPKEYEIKEDSSAYTSSSSSSSYRTQSSPRKDTFGAGAISIIVIISSSVFLCIAYLIRKSMKSHPKPKSAVGISVELDPDGQVMKNSIDELRNKTAPSNDVIKTGDLEMVDINSTDVDDPSVSSRSTGKSMTSVSSDIKDAMMSSMRSFKSKNISDKSKNKKTKTPDEIGIVLDPDGAKLNESIVAEEDNDVGSLERPVSHNSGKSIVDDLRADEAGSATNPFEDESKQSTNPFEDESKQSTNPFQDESKQSTNPFEDEPESESSQSNTSVSNANGASPVVEQPSTVDADSKNPKSNTTSKFQSESEREAEMNEII